MDAVTEAQPVNEGRKREYVGLNGICWRQCGLPLLFYRNGADSGPLS